MFLCTPNSEDTGTKATDTEHYRKYMMGRDLVQIQPDIVTASKIETLLGAGATVVPKQSATSSQPANQGKLPPSTLAKEPHPTVRNLILENDTTRIEEKSG